MDVSNEQTARPDLIVIGRDEQGKPRAARFPASQADLVAKAAKAINFTVCTAEGAALTELVKKLPTGRVYASVPSVRRKLYGEVVEHLNLTGQLVGEIDESDEQPTQYFPATWDDIAVGQLVIAHESAFAGWWEAIVLAREGDMLTLKWRDYPRQPHVVRHAATVALLKPNLVSG